MTVTGGPKDVTATGIITCVTPYVVLTGDWYHFQDAADNLPADLKDVISLVQSGDPSATTQTRIVPDYTESNGSIPGGCTQGALVMSRNGGVKWTFKDGVIQLLINLHFTGGRAFRIEYTLADGTTNTVNVAKISKGTYCNWDVLQHAGLSDKGETLKDITLINNNTSGEVRMYDMYVRVPDNGTTGIDTVVDGAKSNRVVKFVKDNRIIIEKNGVEYNTLGQPIRY